MHETLQTINIEQFSSLFPGKHDASLGNDFFLTDIRYSDALQILQHPFRFDGYIGMFCIEGSISVEINMKSYLVQPNSFMVSVPGYILRVSKTSEVDLDRLHVVILAMSTDYMPAIRLDVNKLFNEGMSVMDTPVVTLNQSEYLLGEKYMELAKDILASDLVDKRDILGHLIASVMHVFTAIWSREISQARETGKKNGGRNKQILEQFLKLVSEYHTTYRNMAFYADRMCLTPKYLSKLIKQASGRSAPDWIDAFVILEAKHLLKYSDITIKEIVFRLHFPNQSVFYKFFKAHTGMTPSEYRNS